MTDPQPVERPDVWTPGNVTRGPDHTDHNGRDREATNE